MPKERGRSGSALSDAALLAAHVRGDDRAFTELIRRHEDYLWAVARRTCRSPEDAADALQDALLAAHRRAGGFRGDSAVRSWLHRIVVNACFDRLRRDAARPTTALPEHHDHGPPDRIDHYDRLDTALVVHRGLARLSPDHRAVLTAVDLEGRSVAEAAAALGVPVGTIKSRAARARLRLAEILGHLHESEPVDGT